MDDEERARKFPVLRCTKCQIQYRGFEGDENTSCNHCGLGVLAPVPTDDPDYDATGPKTAGNAGLHYAWRSELESRAIQRAQMRAQA